MSGGILRRYPRPENFYQQVLMLLIPIVLQNLINVGVTSADILMLGALSERAMSSVSLAGQIQFILSLILFGLASGMTVLNAQYRGAGNMRAVERVTAIGMRAALCVGAVFALTCILMPAYAMRIFTKTPVLIDAGASYLRIVAFGYVIQAFTGLFLATMRSLERVKISTATYASSFLLNIVLNYVFIFGHFGAPALGVRGAAVASFCARGLELIIVLVYARKIRSVFRLHLGDILHVHPLLHKDFIRYSMPIVFNELFWGTGMAAASAIYGHLNQHVVAANAVAQVTRQLFMIIVFGVALTTSLILGKYIGAGRQTEAQAYAYHLTKLSLIVSGIGAMLLLTSKGLVMDFAVSSSEARHYLNIMLWIMVFYIVAQAYNATMIIGVFRAGGDSKAGLLIDALTMWCGSLLLAFIAAFILHLPVEVVIVFALTDEFLKVPFVYRRYKKKIWLRNITREEV
ncbi:MAG: MATE family efflux transporter [Eubacteriales bacterium]|nr:MATE family efflux transporter [Eubacteriales bacterium]